MDHVRDAGQTTSTEVFRMASPENMSQCLSMLLASCAHQRHPGLHQPSIARRCTQESFTNYIQSTLDQALLGHPHSVPVPLTPPRQSTLSELFDLYRRAD